MELSFSELARQYAPWSMSKAKLAVNCGLAFNLRYIKRVKATAKPKSPKGKIGRAVHSALENFLKTPDDLKKCLHEAAMREYLTVNETEEIVAMAHNMVNFQRRLESYKKRHNVEEMLIERRFGLREDNTPTKFWGEPIEGEKDFRGRPKKDVFFRGVWDLALRADNKFIVIDHKSGSAPKTRKDAFKRYEEQLKLYAVASLFLFPEIELVQAGLHYIQDENIVWADTYPREHIKDTLVPWYYDFLNRAAARTTDNKPHRGWACSFCEFTDRCPLQK